MVKTGTRSQRILLSNPNFATSVGNTWTQSLILPFSKTLVMDVKRHSLIPLQGRFFRSSFWDCCHRSPSAVNPHGLPPMNSCLTQGDTLPIVAHIREWRLGCKGLAITVKVGQLWWTTLAPELLVVLAETIRQLCSLMAAPLLPLPTPALAPSLPQALIPRMFPRKYTGN